MARQLGTEWNEGQEHWWSNPRTTQRWVGNQLIETTNRDVVQTREQVLEQQLFSSCKTKFR